MLPLESPRWKALTHAYGTAEDVPDRVRALLAGDSAALDALFGSLCHQGSTYSASFAASPHVVRAASLAAPRERTSLLYFFAAICGSTDRGEVPEDLAQWHDAAIPEALALTLALLEDREQADRALLLLEAAAVLRGYPVVARAIEGLTTDEIIVICPGCELELYVWPKGAGMTVAADDPVEHPKTRRTRVVPGPDAASPHREAHAWLSAPLTAKWHAKRRDALACVFGSLECPECGAEFRLLDAELA